PAPTAAGSPPARHPAPPAAKPQHPSHPGPRQPQPSRSRANTLSIRKSRTRQRVAVSSPQWTSAANLTRFPKTYVQISQAVAEEIIDATVSKDGKQKSCSANDLRKRLPDPRGQRHSADGVRMPRARPDGGR